MQYLHCLNDQKQIHQPSMFPLWRSFRRNDQGCWTDAWLAPKSRCIEIDIQLISTQDVEQTNSGMHIQRINWSTCLTCPHTKRTQFEHSCFTFDSQFWSISPQTEICLGVAARDPAWGNSNMHPSVVKQRPLLCWIFGWILVWGCCNRSAYTSFV